MSKWGITKKESSFGALLDGVGLEAKDSYCSKCHLVSALFVLRWKYVPKWLLKEVMSTCSQNRITENLVVQVMKKVK